MRGKWIVVTSVLTMASTAMAGSQFYQVDDGTSDNGVGLTDGGVLGWANYFAVDAANGPVITSIDLTFGNASGGGDSGLFGGESFDVHLWGDDDMDPTNGADLLFSGSSSVDAGSIDTDVFQSVDITNTDVSSYTNILVGASIEHEAGTFPASLDQSQDSLGRAWAFGDTTGNFDPDGFGGDVAPIELDSIGLNGVWLVRANAVPAPGALALLGLAGLAARRRRRQ